ncbi:dual OB domain-containing protein [Clostridium beijerinckii]|uniref:dual OB domain-containing protein n=1 Tax=Clostridium beijerinckii TaxID=1520 RepID=UPI0002E70E12|nr:hypothetical protein [Clostridium beijerinckii]
MLKKIVLLTKSRKHMGYCTSGIDIENGNWIRIVSDGIGCLTDEIPHSQLTYENDVEADVFDVIEVECIQYKPNYFQPENYVNNKNVKWKKIGQTSIEDIIKIHPFENKDYVYYDTGYSISNSFISQLEDKDKYSLMLIEVINPVIVVKTWGVGDRSVTLNFNYNGEEYRYFRMTDGFDLQYSSYCDGNYTILGRVALIISLGEVYESKHYKLIAKVIKL